MSDAYAGSKTSKFRLWHIPQVPMEGFIHDFDSLPEAKRALDMLADYDLFQYENGVKPDYSNAGGILRWNEDNGQYEDLDEDEWRVEGVGLDEGQSALELLCLIAGAVLIIPAIFVWQFAIVATVLIVGALFMQNNRL